MVSDALRLRYKARGIELIPVGKGVEACLSELTAVGGEPEIVLSSRLAAPSGFTPEVD